MLPNVPSDIFPLIFERLQDEKDLKALSFVSRGVNQWVTPELYKRYQNFDMYQPKPFWPFARTLLENPELGLLVRSLNLRQWLPPQFPTTLSEEDMTLYKKMLEQAPLSKEQLALPTTVTSRIPLDLSEMPHTDLYPCEVAEIHTLLARTPNLEELKLNELAPDKLHNDEIHYPLSLIELVAKVGHSMSKLKSIRLIASDKSPIDLQGLTILFSMPNLSTFMCVDLGDKPDLDLSLWTCLPRSSAVQTISWIGTKQPGFIDLLVSSCKALTRLEYIEIPPHNKSGDSSLAPFTLTKLAAAHATTLESLHVNTLYQVHFVTAGGLRVLDKLKHLVVRGPTIFGRSSAATGSATVKVTSQSIIQLLPASLETFKVDYCGRDHEEPLLAFAKVVDSQSLPNMRRFELTICPLRFCPSAEEEEKRMAARKLESEVQDAGFVYKWVNKGADIFDDWWSVEAWKELK
ncbi:hypothetical protein NA57DRAFT_71072 [Rhizodiscina lignyota]|uniref:F-box domain-containing protein n=1 Tax=Rhizodiscina lignyota TaxID=1504668 RepID=A0A9P4IS68_9PEZI|nr:hypothetical protein NA57DRAFT_71072 [Rhizodiscina lignyota]